MTTLIFRAYRTPSICPKFYITPSTARRAIESSPQSGDTFSFLLLYPIVIRRTHLDFRPHLSQLNRQRASVVLHAPPLVMSYNEKGIVGAEVVHLEPPSRQSYNNTLTKIESISNSTLYPSSEYDATSRDDYPPSSDHPFSPFYSHPTTRTSLEQKKSESKVRFQIYEHDLESGSRATQFTQPEPAQHYPTDDAVWPSSKVRGQHEAMVKSKEHNSCSPLRRMSKHQKFWIKVLVAIVIVGAITGLGVGITKAVGGGVFRTSDNSSAPIGNINNH